jgi:ABC-type glycerol-3-phosphate transport system substrate-binding protein
MLSHIGKRGVAVATTVFMIGSLILSTPKIVNAEEAIVGKPIQFEYDRNNTYESYLNAHKGATSPKKEITVKGVDFIASQDVQAKVLEEYMGRKKVLYWDSKINSLEWNVEVPEEGFYNVCISYNAALEAKNDIELKLEVNGSLPFNEAANNRLVRVWKDTSGITQDERGNDLRPKLEQTAKWLEDDLKDKTGLNTGSFKIYFKKGSNAIKLTSNGEPMYLDYFKLYQSEEVKSYKEVSEQYKSKNYKDASGEPIHFQAEKAGLRSNSVLNTGFDRSTSATEPSDISKIKMNTINPNYWKESGQWISWNFDVPESGLYKLGIKYRQNITPGFFSSRTVKLDGKVPFKELEAVKFGYNNEWQMKVLGDDTPYLFYLEKGSHELTMEVSLGAMTNIIRGLQDDTFQLNELYRNIIMISGTTPDTLRDYQFEKLIPGLSEKMISIADDLEAKQKLLKEISGNNGSDSAFLGTFAYQLRNLAKDPSTIATRLDKFKANLGSLSAIILKVSSQPLELDYFVVSPPSNKMPSPKAGFFQSISYSIKTFFSSFTEDYSVISKGKGESKRTVKVWVGLGRDQVGVLKNMINDEFTPKTGINIELELVQGSLIEATLAGRGPDIALQVAQAEPINYAIRGAVVDLKQFKDFDEVAKRFYSSALTPFEFRNKCYGLPDVQTFDMLFYRKDILKQLGLGVPETWDELNKMIPILQEKRMDIGITQGLFPSLLFQRGGEYFNSDLKATNFDSKEATDAFKQLTDYFVRYNFPLTYNAQNRFRTGESPLMIQPYSLYQELAVAAPEIKGLWDMAPIPGIKDNKGNINRATSSTISACVMFEKTKDKDAAWEFMKWFTSTEAQAKYGKELEAIMGPSARYTTANKEAFKLLPWTKEQQNTLVAQWDQVKAIPQTPGSYYVDRGFQNAFRNVAISHENPYESLSYWNREINIEIERKFKEFGLE